MVLYLDLVFFLNSAADLLALSVTARLAGLPLRWRRLLCAAALGGVYGALCFFPPLAPAGGLLPQVVVASVLVWIAFRRKETFFRQLLLFWLLSCGMGGVLLALNQLIQDGFGSYLLEDLNWKVFFLAGGTCYLLLSVIFRGGARHAMKQELSSCVVERDGKKVRLKALLDTGHTLTDMATGKPVLIAEAEGMEPLWRPEERRTLKELERQGPVWCMEHLETPKNFRLLPYRAVGVGAGMLLCFTADSVVVGTEDQGPTAVALSPTPVSDSGGYTALWGGNEGRTNHAA